MALKIKSTPKQLRTDVLEFVWPGDDAVDLDASDLVEWARSGGASGIVHKPGQEPDVIKCRPLCEQGVNHYIASSFKGSPNATDVAFRFACHSIPSLDWIRFDRPFGDIRGLDDDTMAVLGGEQMDLPWYVLLDEVAKAQGVKEKKEVSEEMMSLSLPKAIGALVLAHSFRK
jgi:hypothetical protein